MTTATLTEIGKPSEPMYENKLIFIELRFADYQPGTLTTNGQGVDARLRELAERVGHPEEWEFEEKNGRLKVKIPKPADAPSSGGGSKGGGSKWQPKTADERAEALAMTALKAWSEMAAAEAPQAKVAATAEEILTFTKHAMGVLLTEARALVGTGVGVVGDGEAPAAPMNVVRTSVGLSDEGQSYVRPGANESVPGPSVGTEGVQGLGGTSAPSVAGTKPHRYLGVVENSDPCRVDDCGLQYEAEIHTEWRFQHPKLAATP